MKALCWIIGCSAIALVIGLCGPARSEDVGQDGVIVDAISRTTKLVDGKSRAYDVQPEQMRELVYALSASPDAGGARVRGVRDVRCYHNCPPPVGSVTASPQVVSVPAGALGNVAVHWRWDQSSAAAVTEYSCLWVSSGEESEAHLVDCGSPGHTHETRLSWIGTGNYVFRVAPGNPKGPFSKPVAGLFQLAQTIVVGAAL